MCVEMKQFLFIYSFIFIILMICVDVHGNAVNMAQSNKNNLEWSNYYQKNYNPHLRKMIAPDYVEQQPSHPLNVIESNQHKNDLNYVSKPKLNIFIPQYLIEMLFARYGTPYIIGMGHAAFNQIRLLIHQPIVFQEFIPQDFRDIFDLTFGGQISAGGKYSFESENYNWTINFDQKYGKSSESTTFKQPVQIDWQKVRKSTDGNSDKLNVEIHLPKIEPNEMIKTRAAYVGGYLAMKTLMEIEEYVLNMMF